ncbi:MAG: tetratricopeptide repeat protein [bacterium]
MLKKKNLILKVFLIIMIFLNSIFANQKNESLLQKEEQYYEKETKEIKELKSTLIKEKSDLVNLLNKLLILKTAISYTNENEQMIVEIDKKCDEVRKLIHKIIPAEPLKEQNISARMEFRKALNYYKKENYLICISLLLHILESYPKFPNKDDCIFLLGECFYGLDDMAKAENEYKKILELYPNSKYLPHSLFALQMIQYKSENYEESLYFYSLIPKKYFSLSITEPSHYIAGLSYYHLEMFDEAIEVIKNIDKKSKYYGITQQLTGMLYIKKGDLYKSIKCFEKIIDNCSPSRAAENELIKIAHLNLGYLYYETNNFSYALKEFSLIAKKNNKYYYDDALFGLAWTYIKYNNYSVAIDILNKLINEVPNSDLVLDSQITIGDLYLKKRDYDTAYKFYQNIKDNIFSKMSVEIKKGKDFIKTLEEECKNLNENIESLQKLAVSMQGQKQELNYEKIVININNFKFLYKQILRSKKSLENKVAKQSIFLQNGIEKAEYGISTLSFIKAEEFDKEIQKLSKKINEEKEKLEKQGLEKKVFEEKISFIEKNFEKEIDKIENQQQECRKKTLVLYQQFEKKFPDSKLMSGVLYHIAHLYLEDANFKYKKEMQNYEAEYEKYEQNLVKTLPLEPLHDYRETIKIYENLIQKYPDNKFTSASMYELGYCLNEQGERLKAKNIFEKFVEKFSDSSYAAEVWLRLGEYYFDEGPIEKAVSCYEKVLSFWDSIYFDKALYKLGWTYYRLSNYSGAISSFIFLLEDGYLSEKFGKDSLKTSVDLKDEALEYIAISFCEFVDVHKVKEFLTELGERPYNIEILYRMANIYAKLNKNTKAIDVCNLLLQTYPNSSLCPEIQKTIIECYEKEKDFVNAIIAREKIVANYSKDSEWVKKNPNAKINEINQLREKSAYIVSSYYHMQAEKNKNNETCEIAIQKYKNYLTEFPSNEKSYELNYRLAECLYFVGKYDEAYNEYLKISNYEKTEYKEISCNNAIVCAQKILGEDFFKEEIKKIEEKSSEEIKKEETAQIVQKELTKEALNFIIACENYVKKFPNKENVPEIISKIGALYYKFGYLEKSRIEYLKIIENYPESKIATSSNKWIARSFYEEKKYEEAEKWFKVLYQTSIETNLKTEGSLGMAQSAYLQADSLKEKGNFAEAALAYEKVTKNYPEYKFSDQALFNASLNYEKINDFVKANICYENLFNAYIASKYAPSALFNAATNCFEKLLDYKNASRLYNLLAEKFPNDKNASSSLYNVALCYNKLENKEESAFYLEKLADKYPNKEESKESLFNAGRIYEDKKDLESTIRVFSKFSQRYFSDIRVIHSLCAVGFAYYELKNYQEAKLFFDKLEEIYKKLQIEEKEKYLSYIAKANFMRAEISLANYLNYNITLPLIKSIKTKVELRDNVLNFYENTAKLQIEEWTIQSIYKIGFIWENFANAIIKSPIPELEKGITVENYMLDLKNQMLIHKYTAINTYKKNIEFNVNNIWIEKSKEGIKRICEEIYTICEDYIKTGEKKQYSEYSGSKKSFLEIFKYKVGKKEEAITFFENTVKIINNIKLNLSKYNLENEETKKIKEIFFKVQIKTGEIYEEISELYLKSEIPSKLSSEELFSYLTQVKQKAVEYIQKAISVYEKNIEKKSDKNEWNLKNTEYLMRVYYKLGTIYEEIITLIANYERPKDLSPEQLEELNFQLEELSMSIEDKVISSYNTALTKAKNEFIENEWVEKIKQKLTRLNPDNPLLKSKTENPISSNTSISKENIPFSKIEKPEEKK